MLTRTLFIVHFVLIVIVVVGLCDQQTVFTPLIAIWKRLELQSPVGVLVDNTTIVFNVQTDSMYADIRIPASRMNYPQLYTKSSLSEYTEEELMQLALQKSFAGFAKASETDFICHWNRNIDYQPFTGDLDVGHIALTHGSPLMVEDGIDGDDYREIWERQSSSSNTHLVALELQEEFVNNLPTKTKGFMVINNDTFIYSINARQFELPKADSLTDLFNHHNYTRREKENILGGYTSSFGIVTNGQFVVALSTMPYLEKKPLEGRFSVQQHKDVVIQQIELPNIHTVRFWKVRSFTFNPFV